MDVSVNLIKIQWNPFNTVTNGPKKIGCVNGLAVLMRGFLTRKCMAVFVRRPKKVAVVTKVAVRRGFTVQRSRSWEVLLTLSLREQVMMKPLGQSF